MDINFAFQKIIDYIEDNISNEIKYEKMAEILGMSSFHFQRMFSFLTGITVAEYVRRRKMTLAGFDLKRSDDKVIDIALKYGYDSHSSFTRTFQQYHGVTPSVSRKEGVNIKTYSPIRFSIAVDKIDGIKFRKEVTMPYKLFGKNDIVIPMEHKDALNFILDYGERVVRDGTHDAINIAAGYNAGEGFPFHLLHGIYFKDDSSDTHFMYGWEMPDGGVDESFTVVEVPQTNWTVFSYCGLHEEGLPRIWTYLYSNWLSSSGYETGDNIIIEKEFYIDDQFFAEVWLPIVDS